MVFKILCPVFLNACLDLLQGSALSRPKLESGGAWQLNEFARCTSFRSDSRVS